MQMRVLLHNSLYISCTEFIALPMSHTALVRECRFGETQAGCVVRWYGNKQVNILFLHRPPQQRTLAQTFRYIPARMHWPINSNPWISQICPHISQSSHTEHRMNMYSEIPLLEFHNCFSESHSEFQRRQFVFNLDLWLFPGSSILCKDFKIYSFSVCHIPSALKRLNLKHVCANTQR